MSEQNKKVFNHFIKGMNRDTDKFKQPEGSYFFALNSVAESKEGNLGDIISEQGNKHCSKIPLGYTLIGNTLLDDKINVLYLAGTDDSIIGLEDLRKCTFTILIKSSCLHFDPCVRIDSTFRILKGCHRIIYFTDGINPIYLINIDSIIDYINDDVETVDEANEQDAWNCNKMKMFADIKLPCITLNRVLDTGGILKLGSYQFAIRYLDRDLNATNWFYVTNPVPIVDEGLTFNYSQIDGGYNGTGFGSASGDDSLPPTTKSIQLNITNLDSDYQYYQIAVLESTEGTKTVTDVYIQPFREIGTASDNYVYTGSLSGVELSTVTEIISPRLVIDTAEHIEQTDNRLLLSNVKEGVKEWSKFQQKINNVRAKYVVTQVKKNKILDFSPKSPTYYFDRRSYMRDEVYAFGAVFVFKNGYVSPVFHIPGRDKDIIDTVVGNQQSNNLDIHNRPSAELNKWDSTLIASNNGTFGDITPNLYGLSTCVTGSYCTVDEIPINITTTVYRCDDTVVIIDSSGNPVNHNRKKFVVLVQYTFGSAVTITNGELTIEVTDQDPTQIPIVHQITGNSGSFTYQPAIDPLSNFSSLHQKIHIHGITEEGCKYDLGGTSDALAIVHSYHIPTYFPNGSSVCCSDSSDPDCCEGPGCPKKSLIFSGTLFLHDTPQAGDSVERWIYSNTALKDDVMEIGYYSSGEMAYYECCNPYPETLDCDGVRVFPTGNIRHHKFPDTTLEKHQDLEHTYPIGIKFFNVEPPEEYADQIEGYYIVRVKRDNFNKTILDKGYLDRGEYYYNGDELYISYLRADTSLDGWNSTIAQGNAAHDLGNTSEHFKIFHSPRAYLNREFLAMSHYKIERVYSSAHEEDTSYGLIVAPCDYDASGSQDTYIYQWYNEGSIPRRDEIHRFVRGQSYLDKVLDSEDAPVTAELNGDDIVNLTGSNHIYMTHLRDSLDSRSLKTYYVSAKVSRSVYCDLQSLTYQRTHSCVNTKSSSIVFGGDVFIGKMSFTVQDFDSSRAMMFGYVESEINIELRHGGGDACSRYYDKLSAGGISVCEFIQRFIGTVEFDESGKTKDKFVCSDYWAYNEDFSKENTENIYKPLGNAIDYCNKCVAEHRYRTHFSEQSFQEETVDHYKIFLTNNYGDIQGNKGEVTNIFIDRDRLFIHAERAIQQLQTKPNELLSNENNIFISAGELFSIPPKRLVDTEYGYGGSIDKWATVVTEFGTVFLDSMSGRIFLISEGLEEISHNGLRNWFEENLQLNFSNQFRDIIGFEYPCVDVTTSSSVGFIGIYDPRFRRYILHKKDYIFTKNSLPSFVGYVDEDGLYIKTVTTGDSNPLDGEIYFDTRLRVFIKIVGVQPDQVYTEILSLYDKNVFWNLSWTISYSFVHKAWISYHSYMPNYAYFDSDNFYTFWQDYSTIAGTDTNTNVTFIHNSPRYLEYCDNEYPMIVDYIVNADAPLQKMFTSIQYISKLEKFSNITNEYLDITNETFSFFYCYNTDQITSTNSIKVYLNPYDSILQSNTLSLAKRVDNYFRISQNIRDIGVNRNILTIFSSSWDDTNYTNFYNADGIGNGYIDRVPNENARNINKSVYQRANMSDKWLGVRMFYEQGDENLKMSLQLNGTLITSRNR